ncbi:MAG: DNA primase DnaG [Nanoarchaeota archaeon]|nr:DNA primase DnaG [Nanoarchaeota archaeon]
MGKISPVSAKYIINSSISIEGVVDRPDVIGAIFGQTEGLLGEDLELRELQRSGRIARIEVNLDTKNGKAVGNIIIPSSLDKAETAIIAAALETIQRIGPCNAKVRVEKIEDVRISKRSFVIERAKELLKELTDSVLPDSQELTDEVAQAIRVMEITEYGRDKCPAGPAVDESEEVIVVEGRADVLNLLKHGFKNVIGMNGTVILPTIIELCKEKDVTLFVDGDRGGDLIIKELSGQVEIEFIAKAPDGKEVEEITKKEIHKALRSRITLEQAQHEMKDTSERIRPTTMMNRPENTARPPMQARPVMRSEGPRPLNQEQRTTAPPERMIRKPEPRELPQAGIYKKMLEDMVGTRGAAILDEQGKVLGKVPTPELITTIKSLGNAYAVVLDGAISQELAETAQRSNVRYLVGTENKARGVRITILTQTELNGSK